MFAKVDNLSLHYTKTGAGGPLLLVHGWGGSGRSLHELSELLRDKYTVYTVDLPGFGSSDRPGEEWGVREYAAVMEAFMLKVIRKPVVYFGHSFGGALGIYLAATHPERIVKLVLAAPAFARTRKEKKKGITARLPMPKLAILLIRKLIYKLFYPSSDMMNYPHLESVYRNIVSTDLTPFVSQIRQSTLVLWGDGDRDTPVRDADRFKGLLPEAKLVIFHGKGHNFPLRFPELVKREMESFL